MRRTSQQTIIEVQGTHFHLDILLLGCRIRRGNPFAFRQAFVLSGKPNDFSGMVLDLVPDQKHFPVIDFQRTTAQPYLDLLAALLPWYTVTDPVKAYQSFSGYGTSLPAVAVLNLLSG